MKCKKTLGIFAATLFLGACGGGGTTNDTSSSDNEGSDNGGSSLSTPTPLPTATAEPMATPTPEPGQATPSPEPTEQPASSRLTQLDCGNISGGISGNQLNNAAKEYLLCKHNETRSQVALEGFQGAAGLLPPATDMQRVQWDDKLEQVAQNYADQCVWEHNPNRGSQYNALSPTDVSNQPIAGNVSVGENLAFYASSNLTSASMQFAVNGYDAWVEEGEDYSYGALNVSDFCGVSACGHFTQVVWAATYKVGCAVNYCEAGTLSRFPSTYLVCNYASAGNYIGQEPYDRGDSSNDVCTSAPEGQTVCENGLTSLP